MAKEAVKPKQTKTWKDEIISFSYGGRNFSARIAGHLVLRDMSLVEIKDRLNDIPGKFAYWKSLKVTVDREVTDLEEEYAIWFATKYQEIVTEFRDKKAPTEGYIKNMVLLDNSDEYRKLRTKIKDLKDVSSKVEILTKSYDMQQWTLRAIANLTATEMGNIEAHGKRSLKDL